MIWKKIKSGLESSFCQSYILDRFCLEGNLGGEKEIGEHWLDNILKY